jgi:hypothetical protein
VSVPVNVRAGDIAGQLEFESGIGQTTLVELFTSEGCSSCPPAERLLNRFRTDPGLWNTYVPLAWHVDYWDYLGWKDRFSSSEYSDRQRRYAQLHRSHTVYTPNFVVNGTNWRPGILASKPPASTNSAGNLKVRLSGKSLSATWEGAKTDARRLRLNVAILGLGLTTRIQSGENAGTLASHDFVVLRHQTTDSTDRRWQLNLDSRNTEKMAGQAIAVWVSLPGDPYPLQATGALLPH